MPATSFMKNVRLYGEKIILVPYSPLHVPKYHAWMADPSLQYLTGSEPLTLEEEFEMQRRWAIDEDKITFIICDKERFQETNSEVQASIGDTNVFLSNNSENVSVGEIEVMIAEQYHRRKGNGKEAIKLMLKFSVEVIGVQKFIAKIKRENISSENLFTNLGFQEESSSDIFNEKTYSLDAVQFHF